VSRGPQSHLVAGRGARRP